MAPAAMSPPFISPVKSTPDALLCTTPGESNAGRVIVLAVLPMVTGPVELPVAIFTGKPELLFRFIVPPEISAPELPVSNPAELIVPVPVV